MQGPQILLRYPNLVLVRARLLLVFVTTGLRGLAFALLCSRVPSWALFPGRKGDPLALCRASFEWYPSPDPACRPSL